MYSPQAWGLGGNQCGSRAGSEGCIAVCRERGFSVPGKRSSSNADLSLGISKYLCGKSSALRLLVKQGLGEELRLCLAEWKRQVGVAWSQGDKQGLVLLQAGDKEDCT